MPFHIRTACLHPKEPSLAGPARTAEVILAGRMCPGMQPTGVHHHEDYQFAPSVCIDPLDIGLDGPRQQPLERCIWCPRAYLGVLKSTLGPSSLVQPLVAHAIVRPYCCAWGGAGGGRR